MSTVTCRLATLLQQDISIITVKERRYVGKLHSYDTTKFTITLQDVRSLGTEQRVAPVQMPPSKEIYEYIEFDAEQIRSFMPLTSREGNNVVDPAIVSYVGETSATGASRGGYEALRPSKKSPSMTRGQSTIMEMLDAGSQHVRTVDMGRLMGGQAATWPGAGNGGQRMVTEMGRSTLRGQQNLSISNERIFGATNRKQQRNQKGASGGNKKNKKQNQGNSPSKGPRHVSFKSDSSNQRDGPSDRRQYTHIPQIPRSILSRETRRNTGQDDRMPSSPGRQRSGSVPGRFPQAKVTVKFTDEFDFDQANEKFKKLALSNKDKKDETDGKTEGESSMQSDNSTPTEAASTHEPKEAAYNQAEFYDHLSTTTEIEVQQRLSRKDVMKANKETFGMSHLPGRRNFFRGRSGNRQRYSGGAQNSGRRNGQRSQGNGRTHSDFQRPVRRMVAAH